MASQKLKYNILYARLSQEDDRAGDSNSIVEQKLLLEKYARDQGFENTLFLSDDGYSGTNFERPSWKKVVELIDSGEVETLIVKDLSRLGREHLQVGYYHADGELCRMYTAEEFTALAQAATAHVFYHRTYCNHLNAWIKRAGLDEIPAIVYGADLPADLAASMAALIEKAGGDA